VRSAILERVDREECYVASEIERVNEMIKSKVVQAWRELRYDSTGDAIAQSHTLIVERDDHIEVCPGTDAQKSTVTNMT
jgi:hypothetical protein